MLSVIIYQKSAQAFIDRYKKLFEPYLEAGRIAFCFWDEHGTDVTSALPELTGIVRGIRQWRAIVALPIVEEDVPTDPTCQENPFDFLCNSAPEPPVHESHIPLIRLAQMLGGVPLVNQHYANVMETIRTEKRDDETEAEFQIRCRKTATRCLMVRRQETEAALREQQAVWEEINDKYSLRCERPAMLYLFKAKQPQEVQRPKVKDVEAVRKHESDSSMFWYRNRYPARARFLTQDCSRVGNAHYHEDLFRFWMTVLTLALNEMPTGTFEAYKLYQVTGNVDQNQVHQLFSDYYNRLSGAQFYANKQIVELQKNLQLTREQDELPAYQSEIPVRFELAEDENLHISSRRIGLAGDCPVPEEPWWHEMVRRSMKAVKKLIQSTRMVLDRSSTMCRFASKVTEDEVHELDEYQYEEMDEQLSELEKQILTFHTSSFLPLKKYQRDLVKMEKSAATSMRKRMTRKVTIAAVLLSLGVYLVGFIPDLIYQVKQGESLLPVMGLSLAGCLIMAAAAMLCLFHFRNVIRMKIGDYNGIVSGIIGDLQNAANSFSDYLSKCCSYMRGRYMLQALKKRTLISTEGIIMLSRHVEQLGIQMNAIKEWLSDFGLKVLPDGGSFSQSDFDFEIPPEKNRKYLIQTENYNLDIPSVGGSGCKAPYPFVKELTVKREYLYERRVEKEGAQK